MRKIFFLLLLAGLLAYGQTLRYPFVHDDIVFIAQNPQITDFSLWEIFLPQDSTRPSPSAVVNIYYRPILDVFYRLQYLLFHLNPSGYHLVNILLHILNSWMVYRIVHKLTAGRCGFSLGVALLFLLHPVQTEAVACIAGISNLLFAFFGLLSIDLYLASQRKGGGLSAALSLIAFGLALLTKEQAVIVPFLILLISAAFLPGGGTGGTSPRFLRLAGYCAVLGGYFLLRKGLFGAGAALPVAFDQELFLRILAIPHTLLMYAGVVLFPSDLHYYRSTDILKPYLGSWAGLIAVVLIIGILIRRVPPPQKSLLTAGAGWFLICLLPVLNVIPLINEYSLILTAEHFLYLPILGILLFGAGLVDFILRAAAPDRRRKIGVGVTAFLSLIFLFVTVRQNAFWADEVSLFERTVRFEADFGRGHILLGRAYYNQGRFPEAVAAYQKALQIMRGYFEKTPSAEARLVYAGFIKGIHFDLAHCFEGLGRFPEAVAQYQKALELDPADSVLHNNLGVCYLHLNETAKAAEHFGRAVELDGNNALARRNLDILRKLSAPDFHDIK